MNLKAARLNAGMTVAELAAIAGVTIRAVYMWETGENRPKPAVAKKVADYFELKVTDLWPVESQVAA